MTVKENAPSTNSPFSLDLVSLSESHREFLKTLHSLGITHQVPSSESVRRYLELWLPLVALYSASANDSRKEVSDVELVGLVPPSDLAWLWHCHRLAPKRYVDYVRSQPNLFKASRGDFGTSKSEEQQQTKKSTDQSEKKGMAETKTLEADPPFALQHCSHGSHVYHADEEKNEDGLFVLPRTASTLAAATNTRILWEKIYPSDPFFLPLYSPTDESLTEQEKEKAKPGGFDLLGSACRQKDFLWQISSPNFDDPTFLADGLQNYYKFLLLRTTTTGQNQIIVPTYQIDLMWHTHILSHLGKYDSDCRCILGGRTLHHDDSLTDRSEGSVLNVAFEATKKIWRDMYGEDYYVEGGMYRGEPPVAFQDPNFTFNHQSPPTMADDQNFNLIGKAGASSTTPGTKTVGSTSTSVTTHAGGTVETATQTTYSDGSTMTKTTTEAGDSNMTPVATSWTDPNQDYAPGRPAFIPAKPRTSVYGLNANPRKVGYVFGKGSRDVGYYHISTRDANEILYTRLLIARSAKNNELEVANCNICLCPCIGSLKENRTKIRNALDQLDDMVSVAKARSKASAPRGGEVGMKRNNPRYDDYYGTDGTWLVPNAYMGAAACGGGKIVGGGSACAGGTCGASGCGGGGCGGGG